MGQTKQRVTLWNMYKREKYTYRNGDGMMNKYQEKKYIFKRDEIKEILLEHLIKNKEDTFLSSDQEIDFWFTNDVNEKVYIEDVKPRSHPF